MQPLITAGAFLLALGVLIAVHEWGHYIVARACGVKVLRFCIGFGRIVASRRTGPDQTEWALALVPLGGYVKMVDSREGEVAPEDLPRAFDRQSILKRSLIVAAGPFANFVLALGIYTGLYVHGMDELRAVVGAPVAESAAARAGFEAGDEIVAVGDTRVRVWSEFQRAVISVAMHRATVQVQVRTASGADTARTLDLRVLETEQTHGDILGHAGFTLRRPELPPIIGAVSLGGPAARAGLQAGDRFVSANGTETARWGDVVDVVRSHPGRPIDLVIARGEATISLRATPDEVSENRKVFGRLGMHAGAPEPAEAAKVLVRTELPLHLALVRGAQKTWDMSVFSAEAMLKILTGSLSWRNLGGPVTVADVAGKSASMGITPYLLFLAIMSISLGVLNLMPVPILDGGHLAFYAVEAVKGSPVSPRTMDVCYRFGVAAIGMLMTFAILSDIARLVS